ncbi:MAG: sulfatase-like hydrolase/transferase, partial [Planctomycetes bacterium]|nr:sulfatase-like hydrolase/transferase [Planctomycetota bacterium]
ERAVSQAPWTKPTVASLFTSLVPSKHGAMSHMSRESGKRFVAMGNQHTTLAESLASAGYETFAITHNANIQPVYGFGQGFRSFRFLNDWDLKADTIIREAEHWFDGFDGGRPFFCYVHVTDPHYPYDPPAPFRGRWDHSGLSVPIDHDVIQKFHGGQREFSETEKQHLRDAYDEEMVYTDSVVTPFLRKIRARYPDTVIVLVGDHGDEFWEHGAMGHGHVLYDELTRVPLLIWAPGLAPRRVASQVRLLDVYPTLLEMTGGDPAQPWMMGESLVPLLEGGSGPHRPAPMETGGDGEPPWHLRGISMLYEGQLWKMIRREKDDWNPAGEFSLLFNMELDPFERNDLAAERPEIVAALFQAMKEKGWYTHPSDLEGEGFEGGLDRDTEENLQGLGYLGDPAQGPGRD